MKFLFLASLLFSLNAIAQNKKLSFKLGSEYELPKRTEDLSFFGNSNDGIVNLSLKKDELHIVRFDATSLEGTTDKVIELPEVTRNFNSETLVDFGNNHFWLHSDFDKIQGLDYLYYDKIEVAANKISVSNKLLLQTTRIAAGDMVRSNSFARMKSVSKYDYSFDAQHKRLLVSYRLYPEEKKDKKNFDKIGLFVFDENMNKVWGREYTMPYTEAIMDNSDFSIDANGNAYMLAKVYDSDSRKEKDKSTGLPAYHFEVLKFTSGDKKIIIEPIKVGDYFIGQASLVENSLNEMVITCTYSKKPNSRSSDGIFLAMLDQAGKITSFKNGYYEFPLNELEKFESARKKRKMEKKDDYEAPNLKVRNLLIESDGSVLLACEESYSITTTTYINGVTTSTTTFYNDDILAAKINAAGQMEWVRKIPKRQFGAMPLNTMSFKLISDASGYYFLYLDNLKNIHLPEDMEPKAHRDGRGGQVIVTKIDHTGNVTKDLLFDTRDEDVTIYPTKFSRLNGNQFVGRAKLTKSTYKPLLITVSK
ncbi:MAG: hypothetical protein V4717_01205 [Bacteroidota bacterium]